MSDLYPCQLFYLRSYFNALSRSERADEVLNAAALVWRIDNGQNIESTHAMLAFGLAEEVGRTSADAFLLVAVHGILRVGMLRTAAGFDLNENNGRAIEENKVDLTKRAFVIASDESVPQPPEKFLPATFTGST